MLLINIFQINIEITDRDLVMLHKGNIVNDKIVEYLLVELYKDMDCKDRVLLLPSYFYNNVLIYCLLLYFFRFVINRNHMLEV